MPGQILADTIAFKMEFRPECPSLVYAGLNIYEFPKKSAQTNFWLSIEKMVFWALDLSYPHSSASG